MDPSSRYCWRWTILLAVSSMPCSASWKHPQLLPADAASDKSYGIPFALYSDRHAVFKHTPPSETAAAPTQFSRAMGEIGVQLIFARSPQAKGRVERTAGTLQDRLVTELRLAGATTIDDANRVLNDFLPRFNKRFRVPSEHADTSYRVLDPGMCVKGAEKVDHYGGGIVYHRHDEKGLNWEPGGVRSRAGVRGSGASQEPSGSSETWEATPRRLWRRR